MVRERQTQQEDSTQGIQDPLMKNGIDTPFIQNPLNPPGGLVDSPPVYGKRNMRVIHWERATSTELSPDKTDNDHIGDTRRGNDYIEPTYSDTSEDYVKMYLEEASRAPLLSAQEEVDLARRMEEGLLATKGRAVAQEQKDQRKPVDWEERKKIRALEELGFLAKQRLIESNLRLVVSVATKYQGKGLELLDLIQEGNMGLMRAVDKFDWRKGFRFSTYAVWWIRQGVTRAIADKGRLIRLPTHHGEALNTLRHTQDDLMYQLGREPTPEEAAVAMNVPTEKVKSLLEISMIPVSLNMAAHNDEDRGDLEDIIPDESQQPSDEAEGKLTRHEIENAMAEAKLTGREKLTLRLRYGLDGQAPRTFEEVGNEFGVTSERARQIEKKALHKMRKPSVSKRLEGIILITAHKKSPDDTTA